MLGLKRLDYTYDAIGNAIGNSIVSHAQKQPEPEYSSTTTFSTPEEARFGNGVTALSDTSAIDLTPTDEQVSQFFQDESTRQFLQDSANDQFAIDNLAASLGDDPFGFARTSVSSDLSRVDLSQSTYSTIDNPYGLLPDQLSRSNYLASYLGGSLETGNLSHFEKLHYDFAVNRNFDSLSGPQVGPRDRNFEALQRNQELDAQAFFSNKSPETRIALGLQDAAFVLPAARLSFGAAKGIGGIIGTEGVKGSLIGGGANVFVLAASKDNITYGDVLQSFGTGALGGGTGGAIAGFKGAIYGGLLSEGSNQVINQDLDGGRLAYAPLYSVLGQGASKFLPSSFGEASDFALGVSANFLVDSTSSPSTIVNGIGDRALTQYRGRQQFINNDRLIQQIRQSDGSFLERALNTRIGYRGEGN